jgi:hypothetical protein
MIRWTQARTAPRNLDAGAPQLGSNGKCRRACWTEIHFSVVNSSSPHRPFSRPKPEAFSPPNATIGSSLIVPSLMWIAPESICLASSAPNSTSRVGETGPGLILH